jgi:hypothetical protein
MMKVMNLQYYPSNPPLSGKLLAYQQFLDSRKQQEEEEKKKKREKEKKRRKEKEKTKEKS